MAEILPFHAESNRRVNRALLDLLATDGGRLYGRGSPGYYRSIKDILYHVLDVDLSWLSDLRPVADSRIYGDRLFEGLSEVVAPNPYRTLAEFDAARSHLDDLIVEFCAGLSPAQLAAKIPYRSREGKEGGRPVWQVLLHVFNHQTHHRGQISQLLDEAGVENDFSNIIRIEWRS